MGALNKSGFSFDDSHVYVTLYIFGKFSKLRQKLKICILI